MCAQFILLVPQDGPQRFLSGIECTVERTLQLLGINIVTGVMSLAPFAEVSAGAANRMVLGRTQFSSLSSLGSGLL